MARARNIKPGLFKNEVLGIADPIYTLAFEGLWMLADREGRLEDRPLRIKAEIFPYRFDLNIESVLGWLQNNGFVHRYESGGNRYIEVTNFTKHQNPHKNEVDSVIPAPFMEAPANTEKIGTSTEKIGSTPSDSLIPDSLIPDSLIPPSEGADAPEKQLFGRGLQILKTRGVEEKNARAFVGLMRKKVGDIKALTLLLMVDEQDISSPLPWLTKVMDNKEKNHEYKSQRDKVAETGIALTGRAGHARVIEGTATTVG